MDQLNKLVVLSLSVRSPVLAVSVKQRGERQYIELVQRLTVKPVRVVLCRARPELVVSVSDVSVVYRGTRV